MKIRNMRWGYDGGGVACGPVSGSYLVEVCVTDNEKHNCFITVSQMDGFERTTVSAVPMFDILMYMMCYDVDMEGEMKKYTDNIIEDYDYELGDEPEEMFESNYAKVIHLARLAMQEYPALDGSVPEAVAAEQFIEPYVDEDIDEMELPELEEKIDEDEFEEEENE